MNHESRIRKVRASLIAVDDLLEEVLRARKCGSPLEAGAVRRCKAAVDDLLLHTQALIEDSGAVPEDVQRYFRMINARMVLELFGRDHSS